MRSDSYIAGFFVGCFAMCMLMLILPEKKACEVSVYKMGGNVEHVRVGLVTKYKDNK